MPYNQQLSTISVEERKKDTTTASFSAFIEKCHSIFYLYFSLPCVLASDIYVCLWRFMCLKRITATKWVGRSH